MMMTSSPSSSCRAPRHLHRHRARHQLTSLAQVSTVSSLHLVTLHLLPTFRTTSCVANMCRLVAVVFLSTLLAVFGFQFQSLTKPRLFSRHRATLGMNVDGLKIDLRGKTIFVAGVADSTGYGWAIAKACAEAGARILLGTWPPVMPLFTMNLERGQYDQDMVLSDGSKMTIAKVKPHFF